MKKFFALLLLLATVSCGAAKDVPPPNISDRKGTFERALHSIVLVSHPMDDTHTYICTGFIASATKGWVVTAKHCVADNVEILVNGVHAEIIKTDSELAVLKVPVMFGPPLDLATEANLLDEVEVIGYGMGSLRVEIRYISRFDDEFIELDGASVPGMSGGPVVNSNGECIGILQRGMEGLSQTTNSVTIRKFLQSIKR